MALETDEPERVAEATRRMKLRHVVITAVVGMIFPMAAQRGTTGHSERARGEPGHFDRGTHARFYG